MKTILKSSFVLAMGVLMFGISAGSVGAVGCAGGAPNIQLTSPNDGGVYNHADTMVVTWQTCNIAPTDLISIKIVETNETMTYSGYPMVIETTVNDGFEVIDLPNVSSSGLYVVSVKSISTGKSDFSDNYFNLITTTPEVFEALNLVRVATELYFDDYGAYGGAEDFSCNAGIWADEGYGLPSILDPENFLPGTTIVCHADGDAWSVAISTDDDDNTAAACADSIGYLGNFGYLTAGSPFPNLVGAYPLPLATATSTVCQH